MNWWDDALHRAVAEVVLAGVLAGLVGVHVVVRRLSFFTLAPTHAPFPVAAARLRTLPARAPNTGRTRAARA